MWEKTKEVLDSLPDMIEGIEIYVDRKMREESGSVTYKKIVKRGTFYEVSKVINGFECFIRLHRGQRVFAEVMGFNNELNTSYYRKII